MAWRHKNIPIETPTQVCDAHHAKVHGYSEWFLELGLPNRNGRVLADNGDNAIAVELVSFSSVQPRINPWNVYRAAMAREARHKLPGGPLDQWHHVFTFDPATCSRNESPILRPGKTPIDGHAHWFFEIRAYLSLFGDIFVILDPPDFDALFFAGLTGQEFSKWIKSEAICLWFDDF